MARLPEGFEYTVIGGGGDVDDAADDGAADEVRITHHGRPATVLRADAARRFLADLRRGDDPQQLMARATGNYRHGNERVARHHPRNRRSG